MYYSNCINIDNNAGLLSLVNIICRHKYRQGFQNKPVRFKENEDKLPVTGKHYEQIIVHDLY